MVQSDYSNAILVLNRAIQLEPQNIELSKDLAVSYYLNKNYTDAIGVIKPLLDREDADDLCYQIAGNIYKQMDEKKEAEKVYKKGLKKFPESGAMYNEVGEILWDKKDFDAIKYWESGIENDPEYAANYYNASKYYFYTTDKIWSILYGEIYLNMAPNNPNSAEVKSILLDGYKKLFSQYDISKDNKEKSKFGNAVIDIINKQSMLAANGINPESLTMIRTRFILEWFANYQEKYPNRLFEHQRQLLQEGLFDAYNQWIFGAAQNLVAYQKWITMHPSESNELNNFQKSKSFKVPKNQYYHQF